MNKWIGGNRFRLLENGEEFFPRVFECIATAQREVVLETFILFEDKVGKGLHTALLRAAANGATVNITIDGFGSPDLSDEFISGLTSAGVNVHVFEPGPRLWGGLRTNLFRRMHRKIVVIDGERAFVGGINYSADHLSDYGPAAKQDYAIEIEGPLVGIIHGFTLRALAAGQRSATARFATALRERLQGHDGTDSGASTRNEAEPAAPGSADALFVTRDNRRHTGDIEHHYRVAIRSARQRFVLANAYFFPGYRLLKELRRAARRGVDVRLILQGEPDMAFVKTAASLLYPHLIRSGVKIFEYCERPLHGKVALADSEWSTVGSSNLDPLSLSLNLEANVMIRNREFNHELASRLDLLIANSCKQIQAADLPVEGRWQSLRNFFVFHLLRRYPAWAGWLPAHAPRILPAALQGTNTAARANSAGADKVSDGGAA